MRRINVKSKTFITGSDFASFTHFGYWCCKATTSASLFTSCHTNLRSHSSLTERETFTLGKTCEYELWEIKGLVVRKYFRNIPERRLEKGIKSQIWSFRSCHIRELALKLNIWLSTVYGSGLTKYSRRPSFRSGLLSMLAQHKGWHESLVWFLSSGQSLLTSSYGRTVWQRAAHRWVIDHTAANHRWLHW